MKRLIWRVRNLLALLLFACTGLVIGAVDMYRVIFAGMLRGVSPRQRRKRMAAWQSRWSLWWYLLCRHVGGMRVTDEKTMHVVEMVVGELNQEIVGLINQNGGKAVGLSGQDGHFIHARKLKLPPLDGEKEETDLGLVGDIERIDTELIHLLHTKGFIPVVMPIGVGAEGEAYNINADVVAGKLAEALKAEKLILMTNTPGVLDKHGTLVTGLTSPNTAPMPTRDQPVPMPMKV